MGLLTSTFHVSDILTHVKRQFGDESGVQITDADIIRWVNLGQLEIAVLADPIQARSTSTLVPGQYEYTFPAESALKIMSLTVKGKPIKDIEFQTAQLHIAQNDPERESVGFPEFWWKFADKLYFWPTPDTADTVDLFYYKVPENVMNQGDLLSLPDKYFEALLQFVMSKAFELDEEFSEARRAYQSFSERLGITMEEDARTATEFYPKLTFVD